MTASAHNLLGDGRRDLEVKRTPRICLHCGGECEDWPVDGIRLGPCCLRKFRAKPKRQPRRRKVAA